MSCEGGGGRVSSLSSDGESEFDWERRAAINLFSSGERDIPTGLGGLEF
jgi:hypothetical protein